MTTNRREPTTHAPAHPVVSLARELRRIDVDDADVTGSPGDSDHAGGAARAVAVVGAVPEHDEGDPLGPPRALVAALVDLDLDWADASASAPDDRRAAADREALDDLTERRAALGQLRIFAD